MNKRTGTKLNSITKTDGTYNMTLYDKLMFIINLPKFKTKNIIKL